MLRLPKFDIERPSSLAAATTLLEEHGDDAMLLAGGTDLVPNMKHELFTPRVVVSLADIPELFGIRTGDDGALVIGAMTTLDELASHPDVVQRAPALAQAASLVAGPQLRSMGTLGGNVMLDTRCQWYNQTHFWRQALGFCLKKDGTACHVVAGGSRCVAAASNDTAPVLMTLDAELAFHGPAGSHKVLTKDLWHSDGIYNKKIQGEILTEVHIPSTPPGHRGAYGKLRERGSIDFPLFGVAVRLDLDAEERIESAALAAVALQARPVALKRAAKILTGVPSGDRERLERAAREAGELAGRQCRPLENVPGDADWRHAMVPVYVRRTILAAAASDGPVHHI